MKPQVFLFVDTSKVWHVEHADELPRWKLIRCIVQQEQKQKGHNYAIWRPLLLTLFTAISPAAVHRACTHTMAMLAEHRNGAHSRVVAQLAKSGLCGGEVCARACDWRAALASSP